MAKNSDRIRAGIKKLEARLAALDTMPGLITVDVLFILDNKGDKVQITPRTQEHITPEDLTAAR